MTTKKIKAVLLMLFVIAFPLMVLADPPGIGDDDVDDVPVDGGISLLAAAGIGYTIRKLRQNKPLQEDINSLIK